MDNHNTQIDVLEKLFEKACSELNKALCCYYMIEGNNDISEATTMMYWGFALRTAGYFLYPQVQYGGDIRQHIEMAAINPDSRTILMVEAKRLYSGEKARSLGKDWCRLQRLKLRNKWGTIPECLSSYACLLSTVWSDHNQYRDWWLCSRRRRKLREAFARYLIG